MGNSEMMVEVTDDKASFRFEGVTYTLTLEGDDGDLKGDFTEAVDLI